MFFGFKPQATSQSCGDTQISGGGGQNSKTPDPIDAIFFGVSDYIGDNTSHAKIQNGTGMGDVFGRVYHLDM